jgi:hypothetical protein
MTMVRGCLVVLLLLFAAGGALLYFVETPPRGPAFQADRSPAANAKRAELIDEAIRVGVLTKVEIEGKTPVAYTGKSWPALKIEEKSAVIGNVVAQYADEQEGFVRVVDGYTGKRLGSFQARYGGLDLD